MRGLKFFCGLAAFACGLGFAAELSSIFIQDPAVFHKRQADLEKLKAGLDSNEGLDSLIADAGRIAKMNDQCASISINDVMGEDCWAFYRVELPAFEERYMRVTGEIRMTHMETARGLEDRKLQIEACVDALFGFANSKDQFLNLEGGVYLEPLAKGFQANYDLKLQYEPNHRKNIFAIAQKWGETCENMVVRQGGGGFAPFFLDRLDNLNSRLKSEGSLAVFKVDSSSTLTLYMDMSKPVRSAYYLNGTKLFHSRVSGGNLAESNLRIKFGKSGVVVDGEEYVVTNGKPQHFEGSVEYTEKETAVNGRWFWENQGNTQGIDFGPEFDADSLAAEKTAAAEKQSEEKQRAAESRKGVHPSLWIAATGDVAPYANKAAVRYGLKEDDLFILPDLAASVRVKLGFGENGDCSFAVGAGGMLGFAYGDELEKVYVAPLAQLELGYKMIGFRETAIFPIAGSDEERWMQFRSGVFVALGVFGVEVGHALITDVGNGGYLSLFFTL